MQPTNGIVRRRAWHAADSRRLRPLAGEHVTQVLLAGKDWKFRALLRAQLIEEGVDVEAHETVNDAIQSLRAEKLLPGLFVGDLSSSFDPLDDAEELAKWAPSVPVWIIANRGAQNLNGRGFEKILYRPLDMSQLVKEIKRRVE